MPRENHPQRVYVYFGPYEDAKATLRRTVRGVLKLILVALTLLVISLAIVVWAIVSVLLHLVSAVAWAVGWLLAVVMPGAAVAILIVAAILIIKNIPERTWALIFVSLSILMSVVLLLTLPASWACWERGSGEHVLRLGIVNCQSRVGPMVTSLSWLVVNVLLVGQASSILREASGLAGWPVFRTYGGGVAVWFLSMFAFVFPFIWPEGVDLQRWVEVTTDDIQLTVAVAVIVTMPGLAVLTGLAAHSLGLGDRVWVGVTSAAFLTLLLLTMAVFVGGKAAGCSSPILWKTETVRTWMSCIGVTIENPSP